MIKTIYNFSNIIKSEMNHPKIALLVFVPLLFLQTHAIIFNIRNNCPYTVWAASLPGGGRRLGSGQTWTIGSPRGPGRAKIWARTNCTFDASGRGSCLTGDCNGQLQCQTYGTPPTTLAEYELNSFAYKDYYRISFLQGFNVPIGFQPTSNGCTRPLRCTADITGQCPNALRTPGGCNNPCTVYKTAEYCCHSGRCRPTDLSRFFKVRCREAFTYPEDYPTSTFTCPSGTNFRVVFCP